MHVFFTCTTFAIPKYIDQRQPRAHLGATSISKRASSHSRSSQRCRSAGASYFLAASSACRRSAGASGRGSPRRAAPSRLLAPPLLAWPGGGLGERAAWVAKLQQRPQLRPGLFHVQARRVLPALRHCLEEAGKQPAALRQDGAEHPQRGAVGADQRVVGEGGGVEGELAGGAGGGRRAGELHARLSRRLSPPRLSLGARRAPGCVLRTGTSAEGGRQAEGESSRRQEAAGRSSFGGSVAVGSSPASGGAGESRKAHSAVAKLPCHRCAHLWQEKAAVFALGRSPWVQPCARPRSQKARRIGAPGGVQMCGMLQPLVPSQPRRPPPPASCRGTAPRSARNAAFVWIFISHAASSQRGIHDRKQHPISALVGHCASRPLHAPATAAAAARCLHTLKWRCSWWSRRSAMSGKQGRPAGSCPQHSCMSWM